MKLHHILLAGALALPVSALGAEGAGGEVAAFWQKCQSQIGTPPADGFYRVRQFGRDAERSGRILNFIALGEKTVTFTSPWIYEGKRALTPVAGGYTVVNDFSGVPKLVLKTTAVKTLPYQDIDETDAQYEGPSVRTQEAWRRVHWDFFTDALKPLGKQPSMDMPVTVERFEVVCGKAAG
ncbi:MAG: ASCH domain-containing protein [Rhodospirillaceae bacterium]|nr:ASCH domain-containing protein [Rhodospirillaceae bacterium]